MEQILIQVKKVRCERCNYVWEPLVDNPKKCPHCQHKPETQIRKKVSAAGRQANHANLASTPLKERIAVEIQ